MPTDVEYVAFLTEVRFLRTLDIMVDIYMCYMCYMCYILAIGGVASESGEHNYLAMNSASMEYSRW